MDTHTIIIIYSVLIRKRSTRNCDPYCECTVLSETKAKILERW